MVYDQASDISHSGYLLQWKGLLPWKQECLSHRRDVEGDAAGR